MVTSKLIIAEETISLGILSDILWSLLKDTWMKIANERSHNGDEDGIIIVGERGAWKTRLHLSDN